jgi:hypothetical protein
MSFDLERTFHLASRPGRRTGGRSNTVKAGEEPAPPPPVPAPAEDKPHPLARRMAHAIECKRLIESGVVADAAAMARIAGVTRARMTQILNMNLLASDLQERLLFSCVGSCLTSITRAMGLIHWDRQRKLIGPPNPG